jgi:hypothetical protein
MRPGFLPLLLLTIPFSACGDAGRVTVRGDFADSLTTPSSVFATEAGKDAEVKRGAFALGGLAAGPATLRLVRGADSSAVIAISSLPADARAILHGIRVDSASGRAFPRSVELTGTDVVLVNGIRMGSDAAVPAEVDAHGAALAVSPEHDAVLFRPDVSSIPDLRVAITLATQVATPDGDPVDASRIARGDSLRVQGRVDHGFVVASHITVPRRVATEPPRVETAGSAESTASNDARPTASSGSGGSSAERGGEAREHGRGRGRAHRKKKFLFFRI